MIYKFNGEVYKTYDEVSRAVEICTEETFDDVLDDCYPEVEVCGYTYPASMVLKNTDPIAYRCALADYSSSILSDVEEEDE